MLNKWWNTSDFPEDKLKAYVASIYKKGNPLKQENYRPISLLTSIYKIYAGLLQKRLAAAIDDDVAETQFGFRKAKSTSTPIACVRRVIDSRSNQEPTMSHFPGLGKGF